MIMKLLKSLYGLRQSPRCWYGTVDEHVVEIGFKSLKSNPSVYIYSEGGAIYVLPFMSTTFYCSVRTAKCLSASSGN